MLMKELLEMTEQKKNLELSASQLSELKKWYDKEKSSRQGEELSIWLDLGNAAADVRLKALELLGVTEDELNDDYSSEEYDAFEDYLDELDLD